MTEGLFTKYGLQVSVQSGQPWTTTLSIIGVDLLGNVYVNDTLNEVYRVARDGTITDLGFTFNAGAITVTVGQWSYFGRYYVFPDETNTQVVHVTRDGLEIATFTTSLAEVQEITMSQDGRFIAFINNIGVSVGQVEVWAGS